jgi:hypothetical protein
MKLTNITNILRKSLKNINMNMANLIKMLKNTRKEETFTGTMQGNYLPIYIYKANNTSIFKTNLPSLTSAPLLPSFSHLSPLFYQKAFEIYKILQK